ncbi:MAG: hypothetical protein MJ171_01590 [Clostridia bacterium]|nr:hypothetical protein [Clostridia bacterium]
MIYDNSVFLDHLMGMIKFPTVSKVDDIGVDSNAFFGLHRYLEETYPVVHKMMKKT